MELLRGVISNLKIQRRRADFVMSQTAHDQMATVAAGAAFMGLSAQAIGVLSASSNSEEEADWVEFDLDGRRMQGWLWKMPMLDGDEVEAVVDKRITAPDVVYSMRRLADGVVAVYPHATCGRSAKYKNVMKMMLISFSIIYSLISLYLVWGVEGSDLLFTLRMLVVGSVLTLALFWVMFHFVYRKLSGLSEVAELIFLCYGWRGVKWIDLVKESKVAKPGRIAAEYGRYYFMYHPQGNRR